MMKLEDFVNNNKEAFEEDYPKDLWNKIDKRLPKKKHIWLNNNILRIAAGVLLCLSVGYYFGKYSKSDNTIARQDKMLNSEPTLVSFTETVSEKKKNLENLIEKNPELQKAFLNDLGDLQKNFDYLKSQLAHNPNHDQLFEAMVQNLKWQIDLLNKQTEIAENVKKLEYL